MNWTELIIMLAILATCIYAFKPAIKNFKVVLADRSNTKATPVVRRFVLIWLAIGVVSIPAVFLVTAYVLVVRIVSN